MLGESKWIDANGCPAGSDPHQLLDLFVNSNLLQDGVVLLQLQPLRVVLLVFYRDITAGAGLTTCFVLSAFQDYLNTVTFLCHNRNLKV